MIKVFLSSTSKDLSTFRERAAEAINRLDGYHCIQMENFGARHKPTVEFLPDKVRECDLFVLLLGPTYGSHPPDSEKSFTELEYETAVERGKPLLIFVSSEEFTIPQKLLAKLSKDEEAGEDALHFLLAALKDESSDVRSNSAEALGNLGQGTPEMIKALLAALCSGRAPNLTQAQRNRIVTELRAALDAPRNEDIRDMLWEALWNVSKGEVNG